MEEEEDGCHSDLLGGPGGGGGGEGGVEKEEHPSQEDQKLQAKPIPRRRRHALRDYLREVRVCVCLEILYEKLRDSLREGL